MSQAVSVTLRNRLGDNQEQIGDGRNRGRGESLTWIFCEDEPKFATYEMLELGQGCAAHKIEQSGHLSNIKA